MKTLLLACLACLVACGGVAGLHTTFRACANTPVEVAYIQYLDVSPCEVEPCELQKGMTYNISVSFNTSAEPKSIPAIKADLYGDISNVLIPFPGFKNPNACEDCNLACPLAASTPYLYKLSITVPTFSPDLEVVVELKLTDTTTEVDLLCVMAQVKVVG